MENDFFRTSTCLDLSWSFAGVTPLHVSEAREDPNKAILSDRVHLTDRGYAAVVELIVAAMRQ